MNRKQDEAALRSYDWGPRPTPEQIKEREVRAAKALRHSVWWREELEDRRHRKEQAEREWRDRWRRK
jgi:hypothetical protein